MSDEPGSRPFVEPQPYRRRRLIDAARLLPILGAFLTVVPPILLPGDNVGSTSALLMYLFGVWTFLVISAALIGRQLRAHDRSPGEPPVPFQPDGRR